MSDVVSPCVKQVGGHECHVDTGESERVLTGALSPRRVIQVLKRTFLAASSKVSTKVRGAASDYTSSEARTGAFSPLQVDYWC